MIHFTTAQIVFLVVYAFLFAVLLAWFSSYQNNYPKKPGNDFWVYLGAFIIVIIVFILGAAAILKFTQHVYAAICLVTLKWDNEQSVYEHSNSQLVTEEEALLLSEWFSKHEQVPEFFEYNLIDGQNNMQNFHSMQTDLLTYVKDVNASDVLNKEDKIYPT